MSDVTRILEAMQRGDDHAADQLMPVVYEELRRMAVHKMARELPGQTLQPTALVHEAWLRLGGDKPKLFKTRSHFFAAAAEAMRRILIENARRKQALKRGERARPEEIDDLHLALTAPTDEMLAVNDALDDLAREDPTAANLVKLRYFAGMTMDEAAAALGLPLRSIERLWTYARAWLRTRIGDREFQ